MAWKTADSEPNDSRSNYVTPDGDEHFEPYYAYIRCAYLDRTKLPFADDTERYWRCSALIPLHVRGAVQHQPTVAPRIGSKKSHEAPHDPEEVKARMARYLLGVEQRSAVLTPASNDYQADYDDALTTDEIAWARAKKAEISTPGRAGGPAERKGVAWLKSKEI